MRAIICGGGIAGLTLAWWLDRHGWEVLVVERAPGLRDEGYMIDFFDVGYDVAELMGLMPHLREIHYPISEWTYVDQEGRRVSGLEYQVFARLQRGRLLSFMRGDLERVLFDALSGRVQVRFGLSVDAVTFAADHAVAALTDGARERADLLVGADGIHSRVRKLVFGPEQRFLRYLGCHTAAYVFADDLVRDQLQECLRMLAVPGRQAGFYPLRGGTVASFFAHRCSQPALPADPQATIGRVYADLGWVVGTALTHCPQPPDLYYDQVAQIEMPRWSHERVALVGDACQAMSLLGGQGASMAMGSAYVLASELCADTDVPAALARYEARVKPTIRRQQAAGRRLAGWIVPSSRWRIAARDAALRLAGLPGLTWLLRPVLTSPTHSVNPPTAAAASRTGQGRASSGGADLKGGSRAEPDEARPSRQRSEHVLRERSRRRGRGFRG